MTYTLTGEREGEPGMESRTVVAIDDLYQLFLQNCMAVGKGHHRPRVGAVPYQTLPLLDPLCIRMYVNKKGEGEPGYEANHE